MATPDPDPKYRHQRLLGALVGTQHRRLYATSGRFHMMMDQLAAWLPVWVDSMAALAEQGDAQEAEAVEVMKRTFPAGKIILSPEAAEQLGLDADNRRLSPEVLAGLRERYDTSHRFAQEYRAELNRPHGYIGPGPCKEPGCGRGPLDDVHNMTEEPPT